MAKGFAGTIKNSRIMKALPSGIIVPKNEFDSYYNHFTVRVKTLAEYIDVIGRIAQISNKPDFGKLVFRGHSDASSKYRLIPTLGRIKGSIEYSENCMVEEMLTLKPEEFVGILSSFDLLSKLQHFGLPTRLLDFTYNPLIALYFACYSEKRTDSRIICTYDTRSSFTIDTVEKICGMYKYNDYNAISLDNLIGGVPQLWRYANDTMEPLMARPKYSNSRIKHQSAVFMVFPNDIFDYRSQMIVLGRDKGNEEEYRRGFTINEEESKRLEYIRKEPKIYDGSFSVNSETLYRILTYYDNKYDDFDNDSGMNQKYHFIFKNRFSIIDSIQKLPDEIISNSFVSILIESKNRKRMMTELATVGIDRAFVFPELEYTAESVKNMFY